MATNCPWNHDTIHSFIHHLANVKEEIMPKNLWGAGYDFAVKMRLFKHLVNIRAVAMHFCGEPFDSSALFVENRFDDMSHMEIRHPPCIKLYRELLFEVEVLAYLFSQQESPRYRYAGESLSWWQKKLARFPPAKKKRKRLFCYLWSWFVIAWFLGV